MVVCKRVYYRGRVQGVGFRYTTRDLASGRPIHGFVRNLDDGRVELVAEGETDAVDEFLQALRVRMARYIDAEDVHDSEAQAFADFTIRP